MFRKLLYDSYALVVDPQVKHLEKLSINPEEAQRERLKEIIAGGLNSRFGADHSFASIKSWQDYQRAVPVRDYEDFSEYIEASVNGDKSQLTSESPIMFATTSGTTGKPKFIPVTRRYMKEYRKASIISFYNLYKNFPSIAGGVAMTLVSPMVEGYTPGGTPYGAMTGIVYNHESYLVKKFIAPIPYEAMTEGDYQTRYYNVLLLSLILPTAILYTPNPSTIDLMVRKLKEFAPLLIKDIRDGTISPPSGLQASTEKAVLRFLSPDPARARVLESLYNSDRFIPKYVWPNLSVLSCWTKAAASFYLPGLKEYFGDIPICELTYCASEGRGSLLIAPGKEMLAIQSHFYEFIKEEEMNSSEPTVYLADQLEVGQNYYILFTTSAGLYRYNLNDVIKVTGFHNRTPLIEFQYKAGNTFSFSGEKLTDLQVTSAMGRVLAERNDALRFFTLVPEFDPDPHYELWLEPDGSTSIEGLAEEFDRKLCEENIEYRAKRKSQRLNPVKLFLLEVGSYETLREKLASSGTADVQIKVSHLNPKEEIKEFLKENLARDRVAIEL